MQQIDLNTGIMKKIYFLFLGLFQFFGINQLNAQVSAYSFSQSNVTYTPITGGTQIFTGTSDDNVIGAQNIGFPFFYNGTIYNQFGLNVNGWVCLGAATPANSYSPLSTGSTNNVIAALGRDLQLGFTTVGDRTTGSNVITNVQSTAGFVVGDVLLTATGFPAGTTITAILGPNSIEVSNNATSTGVAGTLTVAGEIRAETIGVSPNQICVIQWTRARKFGTTLTGGRNDVFNFQIRLHETTNNVEVVYGPFLPNTATGITVQAGLRGNTNADFNNRTTTTDWNTTAAGVANTDNCALSQTVFPANGLSFLWSPPPACSGTPTAGNITGVTSICSGQSTTLNLTGASNDQGITYQWASSSVSGGPYTNMGTSTSQATGVLTNTTYYVVIVTCTNSGISSQTPEFTLNVNSLPTVAVNPTSVSYCTGDSPVTLTATGASTYTWSPAAGLSATTGDIVNASPSSTTVYTVTGTDVNGCVNTATVNFNVTQTPVITSVTATPQNLCAGDNSQLQVNAVAVNPTTVNNYLFSASTGASLHTFNSPTTAVNSSVDDTPSAVQNIGFAFNYEGIDYTQFSVSPDGWIRLGGTAASNQFTNNVTSTVNIPKIYPYWDDLATGSTGSVRYEVTGTAPNRILIVEWFVTIPRNLSGPANSTFQAWLYETSGLIEFRYGTMGVATMSASVGATGASISPVHYQSITISSNTSSNSTPNNNNTGQPPLGTIYTLSPPVSVLSYSWTPATFLTSTTIANPQALNVTSTTTYSVTAQNGACTSTPQNITLNVDVLNLSTTILPGTTVCEGTDVTLQTTVTGGGMPYTYSWTGPNGFTSTDASPVINAVTTAATGIYSVTLTDNCGTILTDNLALTVNTNPVVVVTGSNSTYCNPGTPVTLTATGAVTYSWSPAAGLSSTSGDVVDATPANTTLYTVTGTDANGCQGNASITVNVVNSPVVTPTATPATICEGDTSQLQANASSGMAYCVPTVGNTGPTDDYIDGVQFADLTNLNSGDAPLDYTYYNSLTANVIADGSTLYTLTLTPTTSFSQQFRVWIDFNQDGVFDASESIFATTTATTAPVNTTVTIPNTAYNGITRMRVACRFSTQVLATEACGHAGFGEYEDYNVSITGGQDQFNFSWTPAASLNNNTISNPMAMPTGNETYTVTVTEPMSGCFTDATVSVTVNPAPVNNLGADTLVCGVSIYTLDAGNAGSTYLWSDNSTNQTLDVTASGNYSVQITEPVNGCSATYDIDVTFGQLPAPVNLGNDTVVCSGGSIVIDAGAGYTTYNWNTGDNTQTITASTAGTYSVTVTNNDGCEATDTIVITLGTNPTVNLGNDTTICIYNNITLDAGAGFNSYLWSNAATTQTIVIQGSQGLGLYTYSVGVTDAFGCVGRDTIRITIDECLGIDEINTHLINIVPNPNNGNFVIHVENINNADIKIFDMQGKLLYNERLNGTINRKEITIEKAERGIYMLQVTSAGKIFNQRIVVNY